MNRLLALLRQKRAWIPLALFAAYGLVGFLVAPGIVRDQIISGTRRNLGREVRLDRVRVNPYYLSVTLEGFELRDPDATPFVAFDRLHMDLQLTSVFRWAITFREFSLRNPRVHVRLMADGKPNFMDLVPKEQGKPPRLVLGRFTLTHGSVSFTNLMAPVPEQVKLEPLDLDLRDFTTIPDHEGRYHIAARDPGGGSWDWTGSLTTEPTHAAGTLSIAGSRLRALWEIAKHRLGIEITDGQFACRLHYETAVKGDSVVSRVHDSWLALTGFGMREKGAGPELLHLDSLTVRGIEVRLPEQRASVERVLLAGAKVTAWRNADSTLNWAKLFATVPAKGSAAAKGSEPAKRPLSAVEPPGPSSRSTRTPGASPTAGGLALAAAPGPAAPPSPGPPKPAAPWSVELRELAVRDLGIAFQDRTTRPVFALAIEPAHVTMRNIRSEPGARFDLESQVTIAGQGKLTCAGTASAEPAAADLKIALADLPLGILQPYLNPVAKLHLVGGTLGLSGDLAYRDSKPAPDVRFQGRVESRQFLTRDRIANERFVSWRVLALEGIRYAPDRVRLESVRLVDPYAKFIIHRDRTTNVQDILGQLPPARDSAAGRAWDAVDAEPAPVDANLAASAASPGTSAVEVAPAHSLEPTATRSATAPGPALPVRIGKVEFVNGSTDFADLSLLIPFAARIEKLAGTITGISSDSASRAEVVLDGAVQPSGTAQVRGRLNPLAAAPQLDLGVAFQGFHMPVLTPYTGQFIGREVDKGRMSLDLRYKLDGKHLVGENKMVLDQFELGKKVESPEATRLPVGLAIAILKDREGKIDLDLPVEGDVDDPKFRIGRVILQFIMRLLTKIATSPFALLGAVFGGDPDQLSHVDFAVGASEMAEDQQQSLAKLAEVLGKRPQLRLEVRGRSDADLDAGAIRRAKFVELAGEKLASNPKKYGGSPGYSTALLEDLYLDRFPKDSLAALRERHRVAAGELPAEHPQFKAGSKKRVVNEPALATAIQVSLMARLSVGESELLALANARGNAIRQGLVERGVEEARVFVLEPESGTAEGGRIRVDLTLTD